MSTGAKVAAAVAGGYLLGRTKKLKLAILFGGLVAGKRLATDPAQLLKQATEYIEGNPELAKLSGQIQSRLVEAGKGAAVAAASSRLDKLSDAIQSRTELLHAGEPEEDEEAEDQVAEDEEGLEEEPEEPEDEEELEEEPERPKRRPKKSASSKGSSAAKKSGPSSRSAPAKKTAKKATKKSAPAKKSASSRSRSGRSGSDRNKG